MFLHKYYHFWVTFASFRIFYKYVQHLYLLAIILIIFSFVLRVFLSNLSTDEQIVRNLSSGTPHISNKPSKIQR
ncbi:hypothetical protein DERP_014507 [Dermatophagoides pteronyssinus]|uniref:Uncharacterized protein n=1 Tax=Dermatophagoides pteronyssinus TaxID=6956 RepID=A0ABQ8JUM2_DERPT|nr:hypothetical protein DERP_014507 [Dermatophagoides pteronyssinus]